MTIRRPTPGRTFRRRFTAASSASLAALLVLLAAATPVNPARPAATPHGLPLSTSDSDYQNAVAVASAAARLAAGQVRAAAGVHRPAERATEAPAVTLTAFQGPFYLGIPSNVLAAYHSAANRLAITDPGCHLQWSLLAAIGRIESGHAEGGRLDAHGTPVAPILGPVLDGTDGFAAIADTDGGAFDHDSTWDRAVGPMQFIPSTWRRYAVDGNGDGVADPENIYDSTLAAADYLCAGSPDLSQPQALSADVYRYNDSAAYVATVLAWAAAYAQGVLPTTPAGPIPPVPVTPVPVVPAAAKPSATPATSAKPAPPATSGSASASGSVSNSIPRASATATTSSPVPAITPPPATTKTPPTTGTPKPSPSPGMVVWPADPKAQVALCQAIVDGKQNVATLPPDWENRCLALPGS